MDFLLTEEQQELREEVRSFLDAEISRGTFQPQEDSWMHGYSREFSRKLGERGWLGMTCPRELGGGGRGYIDRLIAHAYRRDGDIENEYEEWLRCLEIFVEDEHHMAIVKKHMDRARMRLIEMGKL